MKGGALGKLSGKRTSALMSQLLHLCAVLALASIGMTDVQADWSTTKNETHTIDLTPYFFISAHNNESLAKSNISMAQEYTL